MLLPVQELEPWFQLQWSYTRNQAILLRNKKVAKGNRNKKVLFSCPFFRLPYLCENASFENIQ